jgi:hypothetical protein
VFLLAAGQSAASSAAPGAIGFLVVAGMGLAIFFLFRSMTKHLRKVNLAADNEAAPPAQAGPPAGPGGPGASRGPSAPGRVSTGAATTDAAANKEAGRQGS